GQRAKTTAGCLRVRTACRYPSILPRHQEPAKAGAGRLSRMESFPINLIDLCVIAILLISGFFAFVRGFVREVLSVAGWVGAAIVTLYLFEPVRPHVRGLIPSPLIADIV